MADVLEVLITFWVRNFTVCFYRNIKGDIFLTVYFRTFYTLYVCADENAQEITQTWRYCENLSFEWLYGWNFAEVFPIWKQFEIYVTGNVIEKKITRFIESSDFGTACSSFGYVLVLLICPSVEGFSSITLFFLRRNKSYKVMTVCNKV